MPPDWILLLHAHLASPRPRDGSRERGASAVEYGLLISGVAAVISLAVYAFGGRVGGLFGNTCSSFAGGGAISSSC